MKNKTKDEKMDAKEAFETLFGFNLADFDDVFDNSCIGNLCRTLEEARKELKDKGYTNTEINGKKGTSGIIAIEFFGSQ